MRSWRLKESLDFIVFETIAGYNTGMDRIKKTGDKLLEMNGIERKAEKHC